MTASVPLLADRLRGLAASQPERGQFLTGEHQMTWGELHSRVAGTRALLAQRGVEAGARVLIASNRIDVVSAVYGACLMSGCTAVVVDPDASAAEITVISTKARPMIAFVDQAILDRTEMLRSSSAVEIVPVAPESVKVTKTGFGLRIGRRSKGKPAADERVSMPSVDTYPDCVPEHVRHEPWAEVDEDSTALILFTSGTTSEPKGVMLTRRNLAAHLDTFERQYGFDADSRIANQLPLHHTDGLNQGALLAFALGSTWIRPGAMEVQRLGDALDLMNRERATHLVTVPTVIASMARLPDAYDDAFAGDDFAFIASTAGPLDPGVWESTEERFATLIVNSYGLTETVMEGLYCGPTVETRRVGTVGKPVDCEVRVVDGDGQNLPVGATGELLIRGDNVMPGYFDHPVATAEVLVDGWLHTGDLAQQDADGFISIVGRKKNVIIRGGTNIYPADIDEVLMGAADVGAASTVGLPDPVLGERVISCVVAARTDAPVGTQALFERCRRELADEKVPNEILELDRLPYGPSGKVELEKLRTVVVQRLAGDDEGGAGDTRSRVFALAAAAFRNPVESLSDTSTADTTSGWDSLSFLDFITRIERRFDLSIEPREVMNLRSLADAVRLVDDAA